VKPKWKPKPLTWIHATYGMGVQRWFAMLTVPTFKREVDLFEIMRIGEGKFALHRRQRECVTDHTTLEKAQAVAAIEWEAFLLAAVSPP
jgi:hypothetical protein